MKARGLLLLGCLLVGLAVVVWLLRPPGYGGAGVGLSPVAPPPGPAPAVPLPAPRADFAETISEPTERERAVARNEPEAEIALPAEPHELDVAQEKESIALRGRVVAVDADGVALAPFDGGFGLLVWREGRGFRSAVEVIQGAWSVDIADPATVAHLTLKDLTDGESLFAIESPVGLLQPHPSGELVIRARRSRASVLRIVDARDGRELNGIQLVQATWGDGMHPGLAFANRRIAAELRSPIDLDAVLPLERRQRSTSLLVGVSGYAWSRVLIDYEGGGERIVGLERGGDLRGPYQREGAALRLRNDGGELLLSAPARGSEVRIDDLPAGTLRVSVELGERWRPHVLGETEVEIVAGVLGQATIVLDPPPDVVTAAVQGVVRIPSAWRADAPRISARLLDPASGGARSRQSVLASREDFVPVLDVFTWRFEALQVGRHELAVSEPPLSIVIDVPADGRDDLVIEVPPPGELLVRVVDDATGEDVVADRLHWVPRRPAGAGAYILRNAVRDPDTGLHRIRAPATAIQLSMNHPDYQAAFATVDLSSGWAEHTLRLEAAHVLEVVLRDGETALPFPARFFRQPLSEQGTEVRVTSSERSSFQHRFKLSRPGTWTFVAPSIPGYRAPELQTVEVRAGAVTTLVIALEREQG